MDEARLKNEAVRVVIAGGGTGGHLLPGLALAEEIDRRWPAEIIFIGTTKGIEARLLPHLGRPLHTVWVRGLPRRLSIGLLLFPMQLAVSTAQCAGLYRRFKPDAVIGTGGYVSGPALLSALIMGIPIFIQEQNSYPGLVNRIFGRYARQVYLSFAGSVHYFRRKDNLRVTGNPVRPASTQLSAGAARQSFGLDPERPTLVVIGGSQGARKINRVLLATLPRLLKETDLQVLWAAGPSQIEEMREALGTTDRRVVVEPFIERMADAYRAADLVLARSGATTVSEISYWGLASILVPYPYATAGHQEYNAQALVEAGAAVMIPERELDLERLLADLKRLLESPSRRQQMAAAAKRLARPDAAREIVDSLARELAADGREGFDRVLDLDSKAPASAGKLSREM